MKECNSFFIIAFSILGAVCLIAGLTGATHQYALAFINFLIVAGIAISNRKATAKKERRCSNGL